MLFYLFTWSQIIIVNDRGCVATCNHQVGLPPLVGMLFAGVLLRNLPSDPVQGLPESWSAAIRVAGLSLIFARSGLELDYRAFKKVAPRVLISNISQFSRFRSEDSGLWPDVGASVPTCPPRWGSLRRG